MFTWKKNEGLSFYINGHLKDKMKHSINKPGLHHNDKFTRFEIARNIAGPPYGHAQFTINSLAFFDEYLSKADALREYIYYWGNGKSQPRVTSCTLHYRSTDGGHPAE